MNKQDNLERLLLDFVRKHHLFEPGHTLVLALSGGLDSMVLAHILHLHGQPMMLAHCNFQLRGTESLRDEAFVEKWADEKEIPFFIRRFDTAAYAEDRNVSIQVAARQLRYEWFEELRMNAHQQGSMAWIATAHHANDSVETMLMNLCRGTGIEGLHGIQAKAGKIIRPLLFATRTQILDYAVENKISWVEDSSNESDKYTRNYFRHQVIPAIENLYPTAIANITGTIYKLTEAGLLYRNAVETIIKKLVIREKEQLKIPILKWLKTQPLSTITWEIIKSFGFSEKQVGDVIKLGEAENGSYIASATHRIIRNRAWLLIVPIQAQEPGIHIVDSLPYSIDLPTGRLHFEDFKIWNQQPDLPKCPPTEALLDARSLKLPFIVRPWKQGDYFYPLGMSKKKKIARLLIDLKLSTPEKENVWVVECQKKIVWVIGLRIDDRFKITGSTQEVLRMKSTRYEVK